jgi:hypothetical protein
MTGGITLSLFRSADGTVRITHGWREHLREVHPAAAFPRPTTEEEEPHRVVNPALFYVADELLPAFICTNGLLCIGVVARGAGQHNQRPDPLQPLHAGRARDPPPAARSEQALADTNTAAPAAPSLPD